MLKHINENDFESEVLKENKLVVVDFFANWCMPCKMLSPILEEVQNEMSDIKVVKLNIDENPNLAMQFKVASIPTVKIFKGGKDVTTSVGFLPKDRVIDFINSAR